MTAFASLTLVNNAAANVVFNPSSIDVKGIASWTTAETVYDGRSRVTQQLTLPSNGSTAIRLKQRIVIPLMDVVDVNKKVDEAFVNIEFKFPKNISETTRLDLRRYAEKLIENAVTTDAIQKFEGIF